MTIVRGDIPRKCVTCGRQFLASRRTAMYCSDKCRKRASRRETPEETIKILYEEAHSKIMGLVGYSGPGTDYGWRAEKRLQALVLTILNYCPEKVQQDIARQVRDISLL